MSSSQAPINTQEDGKSGNDENLVRVLLIFAFILVSPITFLTAITVYFLFSYVKIKRSVIAVFSAPFFIGALIFIQPAIRSFAQSWTETIPSIVNQTVEPAAGILTMLGQQMWVAIPIGVLVGLGFATWRWFTRARWQNVQFKKAPWDILKRKRVISKIKNDEDTPLDGVTLGITPESNRAVQTENEASAHTFIVGGSGTGKTRTAMMRMRDQIKKGEGCVIIDLKNDPELTNLAFIYAQRYGRKFQHFTIQSSAEPYRGPAPENNAHYDPLTQGDNTRRANMILELRDWENADYFKKLSQSYLQLMFAVLIANPKPGVSVLEDAIDLMSPKRLQERARPLAGDPVYASYVRSIDALNDEKLSNEVRQNLQTNRSQLEILLQSAAGEWLTYDSKNHNNISLLDAAYNGNVVVFSLDSLMYSELASSLANLIIQDLKTTSSELLQKPAEKPLNVFIDEFSAIDSDNIIGLINKARASKIYVTIATQTLSDLEVKQKNLSKQLMGIISSFIIHRANTLDDAEIYAGLTSTKMVSKVRQSVDYQQNIFGGIGKGIGTGGGTVEEVEEFEVMPNEIKNLNQGEFIYINAQTHRTERVSCIIEDLADPQKGGTGLVDQKQQFVENSQYENVLSNPLAPTNPLDSNNFSAQPQLPERQQTMTRNSHPSEGASPDDFAEVNNLKKVPLNYNLLRSFFNDRQDVDMQEQEDRADGVFANSPQPAAKPTQPQQTVLPAKPQKLKGFPGAGLPSKPSRKKGEFDF